MYFHVDLIKGTADKIFTNNPEYQKENGLELLWITFSFLKKTILKRKNDYSECAVLLCCIFEEFCKEIFGIQFLRFEDFENSFKEVRSNLNFNSKKEIQTLVKKQLKECLENSCSNDKITSLFVFLKIKYIEILIPDEIDDNKIFENYFIDKKIKNTPSKNNLVTESFQSTANTQKISLLNSSPLSPPFKSNCISPLNFKIISFNDKQNFEKFFEELNEYTYLDISYLFKKFFRYFTLDFNLFYYKNMFNHFDSNFINVYLKKANVEKLEIQYNSHKNLFLKLIDELFTQEQSKFKVKEGFSILLNDESFHLNVMILSFYIYFNLLLLEKNFLLEEMNFLFFENLNKYEKFDLLKIFKIISTLLKINLPFNIKNVIRKFQNILITYVIWQEDSCLFKTYLKENSTNLKNEEINPTLRHLIRKVYTYTGSSIYKMTKVMGVENSKREHIWIAMRNIFGCDQNYLKNNFLDTLIINVFHTVINSEKFEMKNEEVTDFNNILYKYRDITQSLNSELFERLFKPTNKTFQKKFTTSLKQTITKQEKVFTPNYEFMHLDLDFLSLLPYMQEDYNTIFSASSTPNKMGELTINSETSSDYLGNKRIRALTPPLASKMLSFSPYNKKSSFTPIKNISAFKNLNSLFSSIKKNI